MTIKEKIKSVHDEIKLQEKNTFILVKTILIILGMITTSFFYLSHKGFGSVEMDGMFVTTLIICGAFVLFLLFYSKIFDDNHMDISLINESLSDFCDFLLNDENQDKIEKKTSIVDDTFVLQYKHRKLHEHCFKFRFDLEKKVMRGYSYSYHYPKKLEKIVELLADRLELKAEKEFRGNVFRYIQINNDNGEPFLEQIERIFNRIELILEDQENLIVEDIHYLTYAVPKKLFKMKEHVFSLPENERKKVKTQSLADLYFIYEKVKNMDPTYKKTNEKAKKKHFKL